MTHLIVFTLSFAGFQLLAITTPKGTFRHRRDGFWLGWLMLLTALIAAIHIWHPGLGLALWLGYLSAGAGAVFVLNMSGRRHGLFTRWPIISVMLFGALLLVLSGCDRTSAIPDDKATDPASLSPSRASGFPVRIRTAHGEAYIARPPERVVTLGAAAEDWALQLGVVPVAIEPHYWGGDHAGYLPWFRDAVQARGGKLPEIISSYPELDVERLLALQPDLILAPQSGLTRESYHQLSQLAPVVGYPSQPWLTPVEDQVRLIARALGRSDRGEALLAERRAYLAAHAKANPHFSGVSLAYINAASRVGNLSVYVRGDPRVDVLLALGFVELPELADLQASRGHFAALLGLEQADRLDKAGLIISWYSSEQSRRQVESLPLIRRLPALRESRYLAITDPALVMASSYGSLLSLRWSLPELIAQLNQVLLPALAEESSLYD
ncbi:ABC transporter substrate-binding protein [Marinobacter daepoensis]|uniref:ABC transporter substrate-binding protein n=1 Tax=Marinobacter daepoensis TaxID=262077 RepID=UPI001C93B8BA|nr:ABC transporter substrate-binding protein [Marinobacter daepoensis]MBY6032605.1 ABC transporter substrate-binding protein [Marinobacter daepoensis]